VIQRILAVADEVNLLVVDFETDKHYRSQRIVITGSMCDVQVTRSPTSNPAAAAATDAHNCKSVIVIIAVEQTRSVSVATSGQSNLTKRPLRRRTLTIQSYSPCTGNVDPIQHKRSWTTRVRTLNSIPIGSAVFAQLMAESPIYFTKNHSRLKVAPLPGASGLPSNTWFLGPTRVHKPNAIYIGSAVISGLTIVTDRPTDRPTDRQRYSVCNNRPHLRT